MRWNRIRQASLKVRLLVLLLPVMALVTMGSLWLTRSDSVAAANAAYDRSLLGAIKALDLNVSTVSGGLAVELPYRLFEFFQLTATGSVYFRVATADGLVEIGNPDLPAPPQALKPRQPLFYDAVYFGETVRVGAFMRPLAQALDSSDSGFVVIQVAESTASREQFTASFLRRGLLRDAAFLATMVLAILVGLALALRPLTRLARQTRARATDDMRPLPAQDLPSDVRPLVDAINQQLQRTETLMTEQRGFVDDASHQLRTPLSVLRAQLDFILREPDPTRKEQALRALSDALGHAIRATNQLLALARSDTGVAQRESFDLAALVREVALELMPLARERGVDFGVDVPDAGLPCVGDRALLRQALLNLAHNAIQHGRPQGIATLGAAADMLGYRVQVTDDGDGMEEDVLKHLGQRFVKGRHSRGSGLGMAIARSVIEAHGGQLRVEPVEPGPGLCAALWWPR
ncbi:sensor histidine kinase [uncultured Rhodoferax sp.]|uniref:sensor histidine kinase n=1 Tax=uncultured Rhodoferax sp. TaxID=223188 RepID=UPI0026011607|nr:sensor histidine kinase [uncultured Rhodoferax sp.]